MQGMAHGVVGGSGIIFEMITYKGQSGFWGDNDNNQ
jgi:hypothetical protein